MSVNPNVESHASFELGTVAAKMGLSRSAFAHLRREIRATGYYKAYFNLGCLLLTRRRWSEAEQAFRSAARRSPNHTEAADAWNNVGVAASRRGNSNAAVRAWKRAERLQPNDAQPAINVALEWLKRGKREDAIEPLARALRVARSNPEVWRWVGYALVEWDVDAQRGIKLLERARRSLKRDAMLLADLAVAYAKVGQSRLARSTARAARRLAPEDRNVAERLRQQRNRNLKRTAQPFRHEQTARASK